MKIFLTGGSGYLGRNFIEYAFKEDPRLSIIVLSRSSIADDRILRAAENARNGRERVRIIRGDMHDEDALREDFEKINIQGTQILVDILKSLPASVDPPRLVHISSFTAKIANHIPGDVLPDWAPYSKSKHLTEALVANSKLNDVVILRLGWLWGKDDDVLLPQIYRLQKNPIWKVSPPAYPLSIQHITNACESIYCASTVETTPSLIYEFKDRESDIEIEDFVEMYVGAAYDLKKVMRPFNRLRAPQSLIFGIFTFVEWIPFLGYGTKWVFDGFSREPLYILYHDYRLNDEKARGELGYAAKISREEGLNELIEKKIK
ncbi:12170_t:CDS:2 [Ambispora gerdemannii]|uniref:12170_t:CDS:1 n=1 Tax=Ambispora gerdemannii TaxID=144530 RepID=A0A9N9ARF9_9GLOM|nr:12170_t:CDS:2 [Ambispora gerdemannii]